MVTWQAIAAYIDQLNVFFSGISMRKEEIWKIADEWHGKTLRPDGRVHFWTLDEAVEKATEFANSIDSYVTITLESDGTFMFFGNGEIVKRACPNA